MNLYRAPLEVMLDQFCFDCMTVSFFGQIDGIEPPLPSIKGLLLLQDRIDIHANKFCTKSRVERRG